MLKNEERQTVLQSCAGILIVGGNDVEPGRYGKGDEIKKCGTIRPDRDYVDSLMITYAMQHQLPLLGICRGEQMLNVNQGGTLFTDIPTDIGKNVVHRNAPGPDHAAIAMHKINVKGGSLLQDICHVTSGEVNSLHHQSIEKIALGFSLGAVAEDGAVEAIESRQSKNFMLGVQWHPELLPLSHPLGGPIGRYFIAQAKAYADKRIQQNAPAPPTPRSNSK